ncbi:MAG: ferrochelatase [Planctomycetota bacterium]
MRVRTNTLKYVAGVVWIAIGVMLASRGFAMMFGERPASDPLDPSVAVTAILIGLTIGFLKGTFILSRTARRNIRRIKALSAPRVWNVFSLTFCFVILLMIGLGKLLRSGAEKGMLGGYTGVGALYVGIGVALAVAAYVYFASDRKPMLLNTDDRPEPYTRKVGVLLVNLGTPDSPSTKDVKRYLAEFLSDERVIEVNRGVWAFVLNVIILPFRSPKSARMYQKIWHDDYGSPLLHFSKMAADGLRQRLDSDRFEVVLAMRYGSPSMRHGIDKLAASGCEVIQLLSMFPQYSNTTVGTVQAEMARLMVEKRDQVKMHWLPCYCDHPKYIDAVAQTTREARGDRPVDLTIFSFHGIPESYVKKGDSYLVECKRTAWALAEALGFERNEWELIFQSRFGDEPWLQPYLDEYTVSIAKEKPRIQIVLPGFTADCLETLEEVAISLREDFEEAGGELMIVTPALNDHPAWIETLESIVLENAPPAS